MASVVQFADGEPLYGSIGLLDNYFRAGLREQAARLAEGAHHAQAAYFLNRAGGFDCAGDDDVTTAIFHYGYVHNGIYQEMLGAQCGGELIAQGIGQQALGGKGDRNSGRFSLPCLSTRKVCESSGTSVTEMRIRSEAPIG